MEPILFVDKICPKPYDLRTLETEVLGGTEATVIRIAEALGVDYPVTVAQHNRLVDFRSNQVLYSPLKPEFFLQKWKAIVVLRDPFLALSIRQVSPHTPIWVWLHDLVTLMMLSIFNLAREKEIGFIVVSEFHKKQLTDICSLDPYFPVLPNIKRIYNPIADALKKDSTPVDSNKLLFASAMSKGLKETLETFQVAKKRNPDFKLYITNPSLHLFPEIKEAGVVVLGGLKHEDNIKEMRSSLCLFYPNHVFPETFGLVLAESNAVGTPVLTHPLGAAPEVLQNKEQLINTHDMQAFVERILSWKAGHRPQVSAFETCRLSRVVEDWKKLLLG